MIGMRGFLRLRKRTSETSNDTNEDPNSEDRAGRGEVAKKEGKTASTASFAPAAVEKDFPDACRTKVDNQVPGNEGNRRPATDRDRQGS